jgi:hypothetical protein
MVEAHDIELVMLSATLETHLAATAETIAAIKRTSPSCKTLLGGIELDDGSAVLRELGADAHCGRLEDVVTVGARLLRATEG